MNTIFKNPKFWLAVVGVIQSIILYYIKLPESIWLSIDVLIGVVIASLTADQIVASMRALNLQMKEVSAQLRSMKK